MMNLQTLKELYKAINVIFTDDFTLKRAIIYYPFVKDTYDSFTQGDIKKELSQIVGGYEKLKPALTQSALLGGLCHILDEYVVHAVKAELQKQNKTYGNYFNEIFQNHPHSITHFLENDYPKTNQALTKLTVSFQHNILTACKRVLNDWASLNHMFADQNTVLEKLINIQSTGSDFHKGGQQVLILTFSVYPTGTQRQIVYKPSDLEVDCLIMGNSQAVNQFFSPKFQEESLMEILNKLIELYPINVKILFPTDLNLQRFPTYKILPMYAGSRLQPDGSGDLPIRNSYGYIEFLEHKLEMINPSDINSPGTSDFKIFPTQNKDEICGRFYTLIGQLAAVASIFSLSDLHIENMIVHQYTPYLIDLENSLTRAINKLSDTEIVGASAIDGLVLEEMVLIPGDKTNDNSTKLEKQRIYRTRQNRLWETPHKLISTSTYCEAALEGFHHTMLLIHLALQDNHQPFEGWFTRLLAGAIVRIVPTGSDKFQITLENAYGPANEENVKNAVETGVESILTKAYDEWLKNPTADLPRFLCLQPQHVSADLINLDIPVFYHQLNTADVMDSWGTKIQVPATMTINHSQKQVSPPLNRNAYFPTPPINHVKNVQLIGLKDDHTLNNRLETFKQELQLFMQKDVGKHMESLVPRR